MPALSLILLPDFAVSSRQTCKPLASRKTIGEVDFPETKDGEVDKTDVAPFPGGRQPDSLEYVWCLHEWLRARRSRSIRRQASSRRG
jgi:hypothetical protein